MKFALKKLAKDIEQLNHRAEQLNHRTEQLNYGIEELMARAEREKAESKKFKEWMKTWYDGDGGIKPSYKPTIPQLPEPPSSGEAVQYKPRQKVEYKSWDGSYLKSVVKGVDDAGWVTVVLHGEDVRLDPDIVPTMLRPDPDW
eukprot:TRINITY_DN14145_c0_g1_i3.p1 TRINITY_DN14145_c0_g1~~TRINITY_DN14145_c0_g1_i3.p1  ORF type:complete len:143 (+),score=38.78 TRINITY_DN14145_c0_g1_i3:533-961(+)